jgi:hypothetical protein
MRNRWYADNRDLVKWSVLLLLAKRVGAERIIQIAFLNSSEFGEVEVDGERHPIPLEVQSHFRDIRNITGLSEHPRISVFDCALDERSSYLRSALDYIASFGRERCVVFLDPDTGIEPNGGADTKHVLNSEASAFWRAIPSGWLYVLYQHETNRAGRPWIEEKREQFAGAISVPVHEVKIASGPKVAKDVVFFYVSKP